tara:strand:- start:4100 stop:5848 length:1749 start_codon:yes stop_codon:yes gene_type:complete
MIGLVLSDSFLLSGIWERSGTVLNLLSLTKIPFSDPISELLNNEAELNAVLAPAMRRAAEENAIDGQKVVVALPDKFLTHSCVKVEKDMSRDDYWQFIQWIDNKKKKPEYQKHQMFGQVYLPGDETIHVVNVPIHLCRMLKLSIIELGAMPYWLGPSTSLFLDGCGKSEAAVIHRSGNRYSFLKIQNNRFDMGLISFPGGVPKIISSTEKSEQTLAGMGLVDSELDEVPVFCMQKLGRQAKASWINSEFQLIEPFEGIEYDEAIVDKRKIPFYEGNILTQLIKWISVDHTFNFFQDPGITEFFFTKVIEENELRIKKEKDEEIGQESELSVEEGSIQNDEKNSSSEMMWVFAAVILIVAGFIGFQYIKLREELNLPIFGRDTQYSIERNAIKRANDIEKSVIQSSSGLIMESHAITDVLTKLCVQTDIERYNSLTITKNFASMEYISGINPNVNNILDLEPTSFSVDPLGTDSTVFSWYYTFDMPDVSDLSSSGVYFNKEDLLKQLDTTLTDYSIKYFEQLFLENHIYEPMLLLARDKSNILQASAVLSSSGDKILLRKFVLFNSYEQPAPRAGFYISLLKD